LPSIEKSRGERNTFTAAIDAKIFARQAWKYQGNMKYLDKAVAEIKKEFVKRRPADSKTASHPDPFLTRVMKWHFKNFDPSRGKGQGRRMRDNEDRKRIQYCLGLDMKCVFRALANKRLSYREKGILTKFYRLVQQYRGRIAAKIIYEGENPICSKKAWFQLVSKLKGVLLITDEHDIDNHRCRQWALSKGFTAKIEELVQIREKVLGLTRRGREEVEKGVYGTPHSSTVIQEDDALKHASSHNDIQEFCIHQALFLEPGSVLP